MNILCVYKYTCIYTHTYIWLCRYIYVHMYVYVSIKPYQISGSLVVHRNNYFLSCSVGSTVFLTSLENSLNLFPHVCMSCPGVASFLKWGIGSCLSPPSMASAGHQYRHSEVPTVWLRTLIWRCFEVFFRVVLGSEQNWGEKCSFHLSHPSLPPGLSLPVSQHPPPSRWIRYSGYSGWANTNTSLGVVFYWGHFLFGTFHVIWHMCNDMYPLLQVVSYQIVSLL